MANSLLQMHLKLLLKEHLKKLQKKTSPQNDLVRNEVENIGCDKDIHRERKTEFL